VTIHQGATIAPAIFTAEPRLHLKAVKKVFYTLKPGGFPRRMLVAFKVAMQFSKQFFLTGVEIDGGFHHYPAQQITWATTANTGNPLAAKPEKTACLRFRRNFQLYSTAQLGYCRLARESRVDNADGTLTVEIAAVALKGLVRPHHDLDIQVAGGTPRRTRLAFAREADAIAIIHTCRNF